MTQAVQTQNQRIGVRCKVVLFKKSCPLGEAIYPSKGEVLAPLHDDQFNRFHGGLAQIDHDWLAESVAGGRMKVHPTQIAIQRDIRTDPHRRADRQSIRTSLRVGEGVVDGEMGARAPISRHPPWMTPSGPAEWRLAS